MQTQNTSPIKLPARDANLELRPDSIQIEEHSFYGRLFSPDRITIVPISEVTGVSVGKGLFAKRLRIETKDRAFEFVSGNPQKLNAFVAELEARVNH